MDWRNIGTGIFIAAFAGGSHAADFPKIYNTQPEEIPFTKPDDALAGIHLPEGFRAALFAAEPDVQQPINLTTDARGRIWVAENYTYSERALNFDTKLRDRIIILEDTDGDGRSDKRTVFWDQAIELTSVLPAPGGVFALCPPNLLFIPDANGDDVPDSEPKILLDGFDASAVRHNIANGLKFGPDGWIYGRHGILASSHVGLPGTPAEQRTLVNASIWRYQPATHQFEVVANGTTNPWGHDWDENGELFFINTVIGHLWHVIPGAYYKKMYGEHPNPYLYELIDQTADHFHWDTREVWSDVRKLGVTSTSSERGGGHAHSGFMIYLGENWPEKYRNTALTVNYHGRRLNNDRLERSGATYVGRHAPDLMFVDDPWFRGIELVYGPDGGVYIADWSDIGECHDETGVHRTSGRIYKVTYGEPKHWTGDLNKASSEELVRLQFQGNEWFVRQARQILQERANQNRDVESIRAALMKALDTDADPQHKLHALWALHVTDGLEESKLQRLLKSDNEHLRSWAIQLLDDGPLSESTANQFGAMAKSEKSGLALTYLASAMRHASVQDRMRIALGLVSHGEFARDPVFPLMVWYGVQPDVPQWTAEEQANFVSTSQLPQVRRFVTRRIFEDLSTNPSAADAFLRQLGGGASDIQLDVLTGIDEALKGVQKAVPPASWERLTASLENTSDSRVREVLQRVGALFGDGRALDQLRSVVANPKAELAQRRQAFATLLQSRATNLVPLIVSTFHERDLAVDTIRGLATLGEPATPDLLISRYNGLPSVGAKAEAINTLVSRPAFALRLLDAIQRGEIKRSEVGAAQIRQMRTLKDPTVDQKVNGIWPQLDDSPGGQKQLYARYKALLKPDRIAAADQTAGRKQFQMTCAPCHKLYGEGAAIGPDLTGADRRNIDYLLDNILHPNAIVAESYRVSTIYMKDDRVITAIILNQTDRAVMAQSISEKLTIPKSEIESIQPSQLSMMPEGLLEALSDQQVIDLLSYLGSQAPPEK